MEETQKARTGVRKYIKTCKFNTTVWWVIDCTNLVLVIQCKNWISRKERKCTDEGTLPFLPQKAGRSRWETFMVSVFTASFQSCSRTQRAASNPGLNFPYPAVWHTGSSDLRKAHSAGEIGPCFWLLPALCINTPDSTNRNSSWGFF